MNKRLKKVCSLTIAISMILSAFPVYAGDMDITEPIEEAGAYIDEADNLHDIETDISDVIDDSIELDDEQESDIDGIVVATNENEITPEDQIYTDADAANDAILEMLAKRKFDTPIYVQSDISIKGSMEDICDFYGEREGIKPYGSDYLFFAVGDRKSPIFEVGAPVIWDEEFLYNGEYYKRYWPQNIFITNASEEAEVDKKITQLLSKGGALYSAYVSGDENRKIKAAYDYVINNVKSATGDRTEPMKHTPYYALIKGSGTCEAYALLFERLLREMGIPSRVIMGMDSNNHTYNIVQLHEDGKEVWYYYDTSNKRYKQDYLKFEKAEEQSQYGDARFLKNYIKKIKNYGMNSNSPLTVINTAGDKLNCETVAEAYATVCEGIENELAAGNIPEYVIMLNKDVKTSTSKYLRFDAHDFAGHSDYTQYVTIDLNSHKITIPTFGAEDAYISAGTVRNGSIKLSKDAYLYLIGMGTKYENVNFTGTGALDILFCCNGVKVADDCKISKIDTVDIVGGANVKADISSVNILNLGNHFDYEYMGTYADTAPASLTGNVSVKELYDWGQYTSCSVNSLNVTKKAHLYTSMEFYVEKNLLLKNPEIQKKNNDELKINLCGNLNKKSEIANDAIIAIDGKVKTVDDEKLMLSISGYDKSEGIKRPLASGSLVADFSKFNGKYEDVLSVNMSSDATLYVSNKKLYVGKESIELIDSFNGESKKYVRYADVLSHIKSMKISKGEIHNFTILLSENINLDKKFDMPSKGNSVVFKSQNMLEPCTITYCGDIKLKQGTTFDNIKLECKKYNAKTGVYSQAAGSLMAGKYEVILDNVSVNKGYNIKSFTKISSANKNGIVLMGTTLSVNTISAKSLVFEGNKGSLIDAESGVSIFDIGNEGTARNTIIYRRNKKDISNLKISGAVVGNNPNPLNLVLLDETKGIDDYAYNNSEVALAGNAGDCDKVVLNSKRSLGTMPKVMLDKVAFSIGDKEIVSDNHIAVNSLKGVYIIKESDLPTDLQNAIVTVSANIYSEAYGSAYIDLTQASKMIGSLKLPGAEYEFVLGKYGDKKEIRDLCITDNTIYSKLVLPGANTYSKLTILSADKSTKLYFSGDVTAYAETKFKNMVFYSLKNAKSDELSKGFNITLKKNTKGNANSALWFDNTFAHADTVDGVSEGIVSSIKGVKDLSKLYFVNYKVGDKFTLGKEPSDFIEITKENVELVY